MVLKIYISRTSGNMEIKKQQEFIFSILDGKNIEFEEVDVSDPFKDKERQFMRERSRPLEGHKVALPPQIFNEDDYCGDFDSFHLANEMEELYEFLKLEKPADNSEAMTELAQDTSPGREEVREPVTDNEDQFVEDVESKSEKEAPPTNDDSEQVDQSEISQNGHGDE